MVELLSAALIRMNNCDWQYESYLKMVKFTFHRIHLLSKKESSIKGVFFEIDITFVKENEQDAPVPSSPSLKVIIVLLNQNTKIDSLFLSAIIL